ncbi:type II secretion system protein GspD [Aureliella helgolandensis]|uniref:Outer membrane porin HofQ n=1 Tax=Aureliella helgolandensis TaxID=2527968 RepID=A0A518G3D4_9BACT|nr:general secretion pathway protein GspD [Aureliella helgolandensis]QDV23121.1 outer membrane porin HofQ [Aureliella helgolandensis]
MSPENSNQKRRWLKQSLWASASKAMWIAPAILSPVLMTAMVPDVTLGQSPTVTRSISDNTPAVDAEFVLGWLNYAVSKSEDTSVSAKAFAEALRARQALSGPQRNFFDPRVEARLKEVEGILVSQGMKKKQIEEAVSKLGALAAAPAVAKPQTATLASFPPNGAAGNPSAVIPASTTAPVAAAAGVNTPAVGGPVTPGIFLPDSDKTTTQPASGQLGQELQTPLGNAASGDELYRRGVELLSQGNREAAYDHFSRAWRFEKELDPALRNQLKDKLSSMQAANLSGRAEEVNASPMRGVSDEQLAIRQRMMSEVTGEIAAAEANREAEPQLVAERLQTLRTRVSQAGMDGNTTKQMLTIVDRAIGSHQVYMTQNRAAIEQNTRNRQITESMALDQEDRFKTDQQIASLVETYNDLMDEGRFAEAEVIAKQVGLLDRNSTIASLLIANARNSRRIGEYEQTKTLREDGWIDAMNDVDESAVPWTDSDSIQFPEAKRWEEITRNRRKLLADSQTGMSPKEVEIWERLKTPVMVDFKNRPLTEVMDFLSNMTGIPIHIDELALQQDGFNSSSEIGVTLSLPSQIQLRSALNLILNSRNLDFQVANEVLTVTSVRNTARANRTQTYSVKDLVIPIPNFIHDNNSGMAGAIRQAYETVAAGRGLLAGTPGVNAGTPGQSVQMASASVDPNAPVLAQLNNGMLGGPGNLLGGGFGSNNSSAMGGAPPMMMGSPGAIGGGAAMADFDTLMNLIQATIDPDSWLQAGGTSTILQYPSNLSIVVSAPQTTHEKIAELLESLRRLQDLQVTIEVKFITLNDNFFERMGVDFDVKIDDNVRSLPQDDQGPSTTVGLSSNFTGNNFPVSADFDISLTQESYGTAVPAFGGFQASDGASLGFAILSDLEMFFFMNAAQGDSRTNVLQAPRVTMFDGQFASINDTISRPFVTSLIPVVADFAVAQQPVIVVLNEGTILNVQATVSADKRFVRLTLNPSFSQIDRVDTFTFEGSRTTRTNSQDQGTNVLDPTGSVDDSTSESEEIVSGTTVQQPSFSQTNISTTVSVPDGGTILLGGIKRMRESRIERGVPILSKIPYVNRLFKNTAIGRETSTLMMTVTPRIIIQEEEEEKYGVIP